MYVPVHASFQEKLSFWLMECDILVINEWNCEWYLLLYETCAISRPEKCESQTWNLYVYICIYLSICAMFGECISWKKITLVFHNQINGVFT